MCELAKIVDLIIIYFSRSYQSNSCTLSAEEETSVRFRLISWHRPHFSNRKPSQFAFGFIKENTR